MILFQSLIAIVLIKISSELNNTIINDISDIFYHSAYNYNIYINISFKNEKEAVLLLPLKYNILNNKYFDSFICFKFLTAKKKKISVLGKELIFIVLLSLICVLPRTKLCNTSR
jgi:hypothetical protein